MGTGLLLLIAYVLLGLGLLVNWGLYSPVAIVLLLASFGLVVAAFVIAWRSKRLDGEVPGMQVFALALIALLVLAATQPVAMYVTGDAYGYAYRVWILGLALAVGLFHVVLEVGPRARTVVFAVAVVVALGFRVAMPFVSPAPVIDVFANSMESAQNLLDGKDPFNTPLSNVYVGLVPEEGALSGYPYLPGDLYLQTVSYAVTHDIRFIYVLAEALVAFALWKMGRRRWGLAIAELIVLLFLYHPRGLFVLEQAWVDPLILGSFALFLLLRESRRPWLAAASYGYMVFLKEYMVFAAFQWLIVERNWKRLLLGFGVGLLTVAPFAASLVPNILGRVGGYSGSAARPDSLTIYGLVNSFQPTAPLPASAIIAGILITLLVFIPQRHFVPLRGFLFAMTLTLFGAFLAGTNSFANWYYLVSGILLFLVAAGGRPGPDRKNREFDEYGFALPPKTRSA